jgi:DNA-binding transcriptional LysR family regulator
LREGAREIAVQVTGSARVTDPLHARELALAGVGIAYLFQPLVKEDLRAGRLRQLLPKSAIEEPGLFLYYPRRASDAPKLRAFLDVVKTARKAARHSRPFLAHAIKSTLISIA